MVAQAIIDWLNSETERLKREHPAHVSTEIDTRIAVIKATSPEGRLAANPIVGMVDAPSMVGRAVADSVEEAAR